MATSGLGGQAVGMAAAQCLSDGLLPVELIAATHMHKLQQKLNLAGQSIPLGLLIRFIFYFVSFLL